MSPISKITRLGTTDPRMSKIVIHNGVVYLSGLTDTTCSDIAGQTQNVLNKVDDLLEQATMRSSERFEFVELQRQTVIQLLEEVSLNVEVGANVSFLFVACQSAFTV